MEADWSVELGHDDPVLEFPWASPDGSDRYVDLLRAPELVSEVPEAREYPELAGFLLALNGPDSLWQTVKCDVWLDQELGEAEQVYDATLKIASYVDLIARDVTARFSFDWHERFVKSAARSLSGEDDSIACEFIVRRCWYSRGSRSDESDPGFYVTLFLFGYGNDECQARARWAEGLGCVTSLLTKLTL
jgi:hypothetical protein